MRLNDLHKPPHCFVNPRQMRSGAAILATITVAVSLIPGAQQNDQVVQFGIGVSPDESFGAAILKEFADAVAQGCGCAVRLQESLECEFDRVRVKEIRWIHQRQLLSAHDREQSICRDFIRASHLKSFRRVYFGSSLTRH